jgi:hypothetical protein
LLELREPLGTARGVLLLLAQPHEKGVTPAICATGERAGDQPRLVVAPAANVVGTGRDVGYENVWRQGLAASHKTGYGSSASTGTLKLQLPDELSRDVFVARDCPNGKQRRYAATGATGPAAG